MNLILLLPFLVYNLIALASSRVEQDIQEYDMHIAELKAAFGALPVDPFNREWVNEKLKHMFDLDQYTRNYLTIVYEKNYTNQETDYFWQIFGPKWRQIDQKNTNDLKDLLRIFTWFTISEFGEPADNHAWLIAQHADHDRPFQKNVLRTLEHLYPIGETKPSNYAYLFDRIAASWEDFRKRTLQRFGTQGMCVPDGYWEPLPMENPSQVDERRRNVGLPTMSEDRERLNKSCRHSK